MKEPTILLIQLYGQKQPIDAEPLSIEVLAGSLVDRNINVQIILSTINYLSSKSDWKELESLLTKHSPLLIGISIPQSTLDLSLRTIKIIYSKNNQYNIVIGHSLPTNSPNIFLEKFPQLIIIREWGDDSFPLLVNHFIDYSINLNEIPNLIYIENNSLIKTELQWPLIMATPYRINDENYFRRIEASRGCHYNKCAFCTRFSPNNMSTWRRRNISKVIKDVIKIKENGDHFFTFTDEDFIGNDITGANTIANSIKDIKNMHFTCSLRADSIINKLDTKKTRWQRNSLLRNLFNAGLFQVFVGIESLSSHQLKRYNKNLLFENIINSIFKLNKLNIKYELGFILFDPLLSKNELYENIINLEKTQLWKNIGYLFNRLRPQENTLYLNLVRNEINPANFNPDTISYNVNFINKEIEDIYQYGVRWVNKCDPVYLSARNIKNKTKEKNCSAFVYSYRRIQFQLLKSLFFNNYGNDISSLNYKRDILVKELYSNMLQKKQETDLNQSESNLVSLCNHFLETCT